MGRDVAEICGLVFYPFCVADSVPEGQDAGQPEPILDSDLICHCNGAGAEKPDPAGGCHSGGTSDWASAEAFCRAL